MIPTYGGFAFNDNEAMVSNWSQRVTFDARGRPRTLVRRVGIEGEIVATTPGGIDSRVAAIQAGFVLGGQDFNLFIPPSTPTHIFLSNEDSLSGVRIIEPPSFEMRDGMAHFATGLPFRILLEAEYLIISGDNLVDYSETITYEGDGGPRKVVVEVVQGPPIIQWTTEQTPMTITQSGRAVGILGWPDPNLPLVFSLLDRPDGFQVTRGTPRMLNGVDVDFPVEWQYRMTADAGSFSAASLPTFPTPLLR